MWFEDAPKEKHRFERKFLIPELTIAEVEMIIKVNAGFFREVFYQRQINNIYYDTPNLENYWANVDGQSSREKVRIRWYGDTFGEVRKPVLEFKIKKGYLGIKPSYHLKDFSLPVSYSINDLLPILADESLPEELQVRLKELGPALMNRYKRRYFVSADNNLRLTLDWDMEFLSFKRHAESPIRTVLLPYTLLELKYGFEHDKKAQRISQLFPFRMTKNSKYVEGIDHLKLASLYL